MKIRSILLLFGSAFIFFISCSKKAQTPQITFTNNVSQGTADANGDFTLTGRITSAVALDSVNLTRQGESNPFLSDISTAKNKYQYDYSYLITGITANTTIIMRVYDQHGGINTAQFLIIHP
jgi:hypothetical protein